MKSNSRLGIAICFGMLAATLWVGAGIMAYGGNQDSIGAVFLVLIMATVVAVGITFLAHFCLSSGRSWGVLLALVGAVLPGGTLMAVNWGARAPQRAEIRRATAEGRIQVERFRKAGWVAPAGLSQRGARRGTPGLDESLFYSVPDFEAAERAIRAAVPDWESLALPDRVFWGKPAGAVTLWLELRRTEYSEPAFELEVSFASDRQILEGMLRLIHEDFLVPGGPYSRLRGLMIAGAREEALVKTVGSLEHAPFIFKITSVNGLEAYADLAVGKQRVGARETVYFIVAFVKSRGIWRVVGLSKRGI